LGFALDPNGELTTLSQALTILAGFIRGSKVMDGKELREGAEEEGVVMEEKWRGEEKGWAKWRENGI